MRVSERRAECQSQAGQAASSPGSRLLTGWWERSLQSRGPAEPEQLLLSYWTDVGVSARVLQKLLHEMRVSGWADGSFDHPVGRFWPPVARTVGERGWRQDEQAAEEAPSVQANAAALDTSRLPLPALLLHPLTLGRRLFQLQQRDDFFLLTHRQDARGGEPTLLLRLTWHVVPQQGAGEDGEDGEEAEALSRSVRCNVRVVGFESARCPASLLLLPEAQSMRELQDRVHMRVEQFADRLFHSRFPLLNVDGAEQQRRSRPQQRAEPATERRVFDRRPGCWSQAGRLRPSGSSASFPSPAASSLPRLQRDCWTLRTAAVSGRLLSFDTDVGVSAPLMAALLQETVAEGVEPPQPSVLGSFLQPGGARRWTRRAGSRRLLLPSTALPAAIRDCIHRAQSRQFLLSGRPFRLFPAAPFLCLSYQSGTATPQRMTCSLRWRVRPALGAGGEADVGQHRQQHSEGEEEEEEEEEEEGREEAEAEEEQCEQGAAGPAAAAASLTPRLAVRVSLQLEVFDHRLVPGSPAEARDMRGLEARIRFRLQRWADGLMRDKHRMLIGDGGARGVS